MKTIKIAFDLETQGLKPFDEKAMRAQLDDHMHELQKKFMQSTTEAFGVSENLLGKRERVLIRNPARHCGKGHAMAITNALKAFTSNFILAPTIPMPGETPETLVMDSLSGHDKAVEALRELGQYGVTGAQAGASLAAALGKLKKLKIKKDFINEDDSVRYSIRQSRYWAAQYGREKKITGAARKYNRYGLVKYGSVNKRIT